MTEYVATRWYRAPEILMGSASYQLPIDVWSLGCVLGYMVRGKPLFTGTSSLHQMDLIMQCVGIPTASDIVALDAPYAKRIIDRTEVLHNSSIKRICPKVSPVMANVINDNSYQSYSGK
eukprot:m.68792 g.68792  ORF g.68792 m.68792 type:complete len:119 (-) comp12205_c0_seq1:2103-2459(-)